VQRHALTHEQWRSIQSLFPPPKRTGRPRSDLRLMLEAALWIVRTGAPWRDLPDRFGPWQTAYEWFNRWSRDGTWDRVLEALQIRLDREGRVDWDMWCIDGSNVRASRAAAGAGKRGALENPEITLWGAREADSAPSSTWLLTATAFPSLSR
jgi:transposase